MTLFNKIRFGFHIWFDLLEGTFRFLTFLAIFVPMIIMFQSYSWTLVLICLIGLSRVDYIHFYNKDIHGGFKN